MCPQHGYDPAGEGDMAKLARLTADADEEIFSLFTYLNELHIDVDSLDQRIGERNLHP